MFESFREHTKVTDERTGKVYAYSSLDTVMENPIKPRRRRDNMESFWMAETLKYFYLLFSELDGTDGLPRLEDIVINTEAHILPRFNIEGSKIWKTGWERKARIPKGEQAAVGLGLKLDPKDDWSRDIKQGSIGLDAQDKVILTDDGVRKKDDKRLDDTLRKMEEELGDKKKRDSGKPRREVLGDAVDVEERDAS